MCGTFVFVLQHRRECLKKIKTIKKIRYLLKSVNKFQSLACSLQRFRHNNLVNNSQEVETMIVFIISIIS